MEEPCRFAVNFPALGKGLRHGRKQVFLGLGHGLVAFLFNAEMPDFIVFSMQ